MKMDKNKKKTNKNKEKVNNKIKNQNIQNLYYKL